MEHAGTLIVMRAFLLCLLTWFSGRLRQDSQGRTGRCPQGATLKGEI